MQWSLGNECDVQGFLMAQVLVWRRMCRHMCVCMYVCMCILLCIVYVCIYVCMYVCMYKMTSSTPPLCTTWLVSYFYKSLSKIQFLSPICTVNESHFNCNQSGTFKLLTATEACQRVCTYHSSHSLRKWKYLYENETLDAVKSDGEWEGFAFVQGFLMAQVLVWGRMYVSIHV